MVTKFILAAACSIALWACAEGIVCAGCGGSITCPPQPTGCPLAREPCGCCDVCALGMGDMCHDFSAGCGPGLMCHTTIGSFNSRPPPGSGIRGICVKSTLTDAIVAPPIPDIPPTPTPKIGIVGRKKRLS